MKKKTTIRVEEGTVDVQAQALEKLERTLQLLLEITFVGEYVHQHP